MLAEKLSNLFIIQSSKVIKIRPTNSLQHALSNDFQFFLQLFKIHLLFLVNEGILFQNVK